jgi:hypothetical protein
MARTRLVGLLVAAALGAAGLVPASAAPAIPRLGPLDPVRALHDATLALAAGPHDDRVAAWRRALLTSAAASPAPADGPREWAAVYDAGDVDGDRRNDLVVMRTDGTAVRSGRDGRVLLRRAHSSLLPVTGAGAVRLVALDVEFTDDDDGYAVELRVSGLDRTGTALWEHAVRGTIEGYGIGPAYAGRFDRFPAMLYDGRLGPDGRPALMLGTLTGAHGSLGAATRLDLSLLSVVDGSSSPLPAVHGLGAGTPWAFPYETAAGSCHTATAPVGALTVASLVCDGASRWSGVVDLTDPYVVPAGDFDGDRTSDLMLSTFSFDDEEPGSAALGTRILAYDDGDELAAADVDGLVPIGGDVSRDGQPDFLELSFEDVGFGIRGVTLAGEQLWKRAVELRGSGYLEGHVGLDVTGDGLGDAFLRAEPEKGTPVALVVDARDGRTMTVPGVDALLAPGLRARGADLAVLEPARGRLRARVLSGDRARTLLDTRLPGPAATPAAGGVGAADLDGDGRRDLVVAARTSDRRITTALSATGRVLWQQSEKASPVGPGGPVVIVVGGDD